MSCPSSRPLPPLVPHPFRGASGRRAVCALLSVALLAGVAGSCGLPESDGPPEAVSVGRPIIYGSADTNPAHMAVVALTPGPGWGSFCTGTLITPTVVVTAAHCMENQNAGTFQIFFGNSVFSQGTYRSVSEVQVYPYYNAQTVEHDIALVRLSSPAPSSVTPIPALPASMGLTSADEGSAVTFSGFGLDENNQSGVKLTVTTTIGKVCNGSNSCYWGGAIIAGDAMGYAQSNGGPCSGDSGGPAFVNRSGQEYLAGVTSYGDPNCSQYGVSTMVHAYETFIANFTGGVTPEVCTNGVDDDGDGAVDCDDSDCTNASACQGPDACEAAQLVGCGQTVSDTTVGGDTAFTNNACLQQAEQGPERAFELSVPAGTQVTVNLTPGGSGDLDLMLFPASGSGCNIDTCLGSSLESGTVPESLSFTMPSGGAFVVVETWDTPSPFSLAVTCQGGTRENCDNGLDDDGDGAVDCADTDCASAANCQTTPEVCDNGLDDDRDGATDCADSDCDGAVACQPSAEVCDNGLDDDGDGAADCADPDCTGSAVCQPGVENCANGVDDDGDGAADCADSDCSQAGICQPGVENCTNGLDDDGDGSTDCADPDCRQAVVCQTAAGEACGNGRDDDGDGAVDCADPNCIGDPACQGHENCVNGMDDDGDGVADCEDADCQTAPNCQTDKLTSGGCSCQQPGPAAPSAPATVLFGLGLWLGWRRRRL